MCFCDPFCRPATGPYCSRKFLWETNVEGTRNLIKACRAHGVTQLIYLSSSCVVDAGNDIQNGDEESLPYPRHHLDHYSTTKAEAERLVLMANGSPTGPQGRWARDDLLSGFTRRRSIGSGIDGSADGGESD